MLIIGKSYIEIGGIVISNQFGPSDVSIEENEENQRRKKEVSVFKMIMTILVVWISAWTPYLILHCWLMFGNLEYLSVEMAVVPTLCCKLSAAANSFIYGVRYFATIYE